MSAEPTSPELPSVEGERAASPVSGARKSDRRSMHRRGIGAVALIAFGALFIWGWGRPKGKIDEAGATPIVSQRTRYEPPQEPPSPPEIPLQQAVLIPPTRPNAEPQRRSDEDQLLDAARRAPVLVYNKPPQNRPQGAPGDPEFASSALSSGALPFDRSEPRNELADRLRPTVLDGVRASRLPNRSLLVAQGTPIPCVLETAMSSDVPGFVSCVIARDVMSDDGHVVLMEKGTQVVGEYRGQVRRGSSRMFVLWNRAKTPTGVIVSLSSPATDALGRSGFDGQIDSHFWERFGGALLLSIVGDAGQIVGQRLSDGGIEINTAGSAGQSAAAIATEQSINIPPTLLKNQGEHVSIFVARDLDFSSVYTLRRIGTRTEIFDRAIGVRPRQPVYKP